MPGPRPIHEGREAHGPGDPVEARRPQLFAARRERSDGVIALTPSSRHLQLLHEACDQSEQVTRSVTAGVVGDRAGEQQRIQSCRGSNASILEARRSLRRPWELALGQLLWVLGDGVDSGRQDIAHESSFRSMALD